MEVNTNHSLIRTKLNRPRVTSELVERPRLVEKLNRGSARKLTLVSAPAGYGKTTLVGEWLAQVDRPVAWYSLDEHDSELFIFTQYLAASLQSIFPDACTGISELLQSPQIQTDETLATTLINDIAKLARGLLMIFG